MGLLKDIVRQWVGIEGQKASAAAPIIAYSHAGKPKWTPRRYDALASEGFQKNVIAYRCVMQIATAASSVPWLLYDLDNNELTQHPLLTLLRHPNPLQDGVSFLENIYANLEISGNAYVEAVFADDDGAPPVELYALRPDRMRVVPGATGLPESYQYTVGGRTTTWPADPLTGRSAILHIKKFHPLDDWYGLAPIEAAMLAVDQHNAAGAWNQSLLNQGARPSGALVFAPKEGPATLTDEQMQRLREEFGQLYQGERNAGRPLILEGGLDWREMSLSPKDMDWLSGRHAAARDIALAFGVPAQLVGIPDSQTYANMAEARLAFYEDTVLPLLGRVIGAFDHWLTPLFGDALTLDFDLDDISALATRRDEQWKKLQATDYLTVNEKRAAVGYPPIDGGDSVTGRKAAGIAGRDDKGKAKFNPYHDPDNGQFTFAPGGAGGGGDTTDKPVGRDKPAKPVVSRHPPKSLKPSAKVIDFIKGYEKFIPKVYGDAAEYQTIGFGHKIKPGESFPNGITREEALRLFQEDLGQTVNAVQRYVTAPLAQYEFDAVVSFTFNVGTSALRRSTMLRLINEEKMPEAANEFPKWNLVRNPKTGILEPNKGLTSRRQDERLIFLEGHYNKT